MRRPIQKRGLILRPETWQKLLGEKITADLLNDPLVHNARLRLESVRSGKVQSGASGVNESRKTVGPLRRVRLRKASPLTQPDLQLREVGSVEREISRTPLLRSNQLRLSKSFMLLRIVQGGKTGSKKDRLWTH